MEAVQPVPAEYRHVVFPARPAFNSRPISFVRGSRPIPQSTLAEQLDPQEKDCLRWVFERAGLALDDYRPEMIKRRLPACLRAMRLQSVWQIRSAVELYPAQLDTALNALLIGVTGFFRDAGVFAALDSLVLPRLLHEQPYPRICSAGCSDGAELYTLGMMLAERNVLYGSALLGVDCRPDAIARASAGRYDAEAVRNLPPGLLGEYFVSHGPGWRVNPRLRSSVCWRTANVMKLSGAWDLILCRNLSIYLGATTAELLWARLERCLTPGGILVLGKAERPIGAKELTLIAPCIYRRSRS